MDDFVNVALRTEGVDRNVFTHLFQLDLFLSPSVRRAWIEIRAFIAQPGQPGVALRTEGVDRNARVTPLYSSWYTVALRTEGVDRNHLAGVSGKNIIVALRIEGLGRNLILIV